MTENDRHLTLYNPPNLMINHIEKVTKSGSASEHFRSIIISQIKEDKIQHPEIYERYDEIIDSELIDDDILFFAMRLCKFPTFSLNGEGNNMDIRIDEWTHKELCRYQRIHGFKSLSDAVKYMWAISTVSDLRASPKCREMVETAIKKVERFFKFRPEFITFVVNYVENQQNIFP